MKQLRILGFVALVGIVSIVYAKPNSAHKLLCKSILTIVPAKVTIDASAVKKAIKQGADVNTACTIQGKEYLPLELALYAIKFELSKSKRASKSMSIIKLLLQAGANPNKANQKGMTAVMLAKWLQDMKLVDALVKYGGDADVQPACFGDEATIENLSSQLTSVPSSSLCKSILTLVPAKVKIDISGVKKAIKYGANVNEPCLIKGKEYLPLELAIQAMKEERSSVNRIKDSLQVIEILLQAKADPNKSNRDGNTALMLAQQFQESELIDLLMKYGADTGALPACKNEQEQVEQEQIIEDMEFPAIESEDIPLIQEPSTDEPIEVPATFEPIMEEPTPTADELIEAEPVESDEDLIDQDMVADDEEILEETSTEEEPVQDEPIIESQDEIIEEVPATEEEEIVSEDVEEPVVSDETEAEPEELVQEELQVEPAPVALPDTDEDEEEIIEEDEQANEDTDSDDEFEDEYEENEDDEEELE